MIHVLRIFLLSALLFAAPVAALALEVPQLQGRVNDYAAMLSPEAKAQLEQQLSLLEREDSTQVVVLTIPSLQGEVLEEYAIKVAERWRIGQKGLDNGAILLIAKQERKLRIEVGRGLEGKLTDLVSGQIIRNDITPYFKKGDFAGGIAAGVTAIARVVKGEYQAAPKNKPHPGKRSAPPWPTLLLALLFATLFLGAISRYLGGAAGAVGLPIIAHLLVPGLALGILAGIAVAGFVIGLIISMLLGGGGGFGGPFLGGGFGGGFYGGGGGSSGGDSGFSGGGGDFGGGGASGDW